VAAAWRRQPGSGRRRRRRRRRATRVGSTTTTTTTTTTTGRVDDDDDDDDDDGVDDDGSGPGRGSVKSGSGRRRSVGSPPSPQPSRPRTGGTAFRPPSTEDRRADAFACYQ